MIATNRKPVLAMAGITAGLASVLAPSTAYAEPAPRPAAEPAPQDASPLSTAALPTCAGGTRTNYPDGVYLLAPTVTNGGGNYDCVLGVGNSGNGVRKLQGALHHCYDNSVAIDGIYGQDTRDAVAEVQRIKGIPADGVYGPQTRDEMRWALYRQSDNAFSRCTFVTFP
jgi:hypothetical protein